MLVAKRFRLLLVIAAGLLIAIAAGWGCVTAPRTIPADALGPVTEVLGYTGGTPAITRKVEPDSAEANAVREWLRGHSTGWRLSLNDYVPARRINGPDFALNFIDRLCVLNYRQPDGNWVQVVRPLAEGETPPDVFGR